jgi:class 3 adenylate cyclase/TolB-like protein
MAEQSVQRKLTTVFYADVVGYSRLTGIDEATTHHAVMDLLDFVKEAIEGTGGKVLRYAGDAILAEYSSVVSCVEAAVFIQTELLERSQDTPQEQRVLIRVGINLGEVIEERGEIYGDGVNIAARLESCAPPGGICITKQVAEQTAGKIVAEFGNAGRHMFKNIARPIEVCCWPVEAAKSLRRTAGVRKRIAAIISGLSVVVLIGLYFLSTNAQKAPLANGVKIAVIPFEELDKKSGGAYFSDGLTKDINTYLSRFTNLVVFAPGAVSEYRQNATCEKIRNELNADYILAGSVRRAQNQLRVTTTLTETSTCRQLISPGPYNRNLDSRNLLDIQIEIAQQVAATLGSGDAPLFNASLQAKIRNKSPNSLESYDCVLLSYWFYENFDADRHKRARSCLEKSVKVDPDYSIGWSRLAFAYIESKKYAINTPEDWEKQARTAANQAINLDPDNAWAYYALAILTQMTTQDLSKFRGFAERAIELNPNDAFVLADLGTWMGYAGEWETAKEWVSRSMKLNPKHQGWLWQTWHLYYFHEEEYEKSRDMALKMNLSGNYMVQASLTSAYAMNGEQNKAEETLLHLLEIQPNYPDDPRAPFRARGIPVELIEGLMAGLQKAGLEVKPIQ